MASECLSVPCPTLTNTPMRRGRSVTRKLWRSGRVGVPLRLAVAVAVAFGVTACKKQGHVNVGRDTTTHQSRRVRLSAAATRSDKSGKQVAVSEKVASWGTDTMTVGDCGSDNVSVTIRSDGTAHLASVSWTWTTHSGDHWWWSVNGQDAQQVTLWRTSSHQGPRMDDGQPPPRYHNDYDFTFDAAQYDATQSIQLFYTC